MASMETIEIPIDFSLGPDKGGRISGQASHSFSSNVMSAAAAINSFYIECDKDRHVHAFGASIDEVQSDRSSTTVTVNASLQFTDKGEHKLIRESCSMTVQVIAWCDARSD